MPRTATSSDRHSQPGTSTADGFLGEDVAVEIQITENRQWQLRVYQRTEPGNELASQVADDITGPHAQAMVAASRVDMAPGYEVVQGGDTEMMVESFGYMAEALLLAVIFVYLILAAQFESFIDPLSIMLSLPLSIVGMAAGLSAARGVLDVGIAVPLTRSEAITANYHWVYRDVDSVLLPTDTEETVAGKCIEMMPPV